MARRLLLRQEHLAVGARAHLLQEPVAVGHGLVLDLDHVGQLEQGRLAALLLDALDGLDAHALEYRNNGDGRVSRVISLVLGTQVIEHLFLAVAPGTEHALVVELARKQLLRLGPHSLLGLDQQLLDLALEPALQRVLAHDHPRLEELLDLLLLTVRLLQHVLQPRLVALLQLVAPPALDALQRLQEELLQPLQALLLREGNAAAVHHLLVPEVYPVLGDGLQSLFLPKRLLPRQDVHGLGVPLVLGAINFLLFFILQREPGRFLEGRRLFFDEGDDALEEGGGSFGALEQLLPRLRVAGLLGD